MKRLTQVALLVLFSTTLFAQGTITQTTVNAGHPLARFEVDGTTYIGAATFTWPEGSSHFIRFQVTNALVDETLQLRSDGAIALRFQGWESSSGNILDGSGTTLVILASRDITSYQATVLVSYRVRLSFFDTGVEPVTGCANPSALTPEAWGPGLAYIDGTCYAGSAEFYLAEGQHVISAFPLPGFAFLGWSLDNNSAVPFLQTLNLQSPMVLTPVFRPAKRVTFRTEPLGFDLLLDRTNTATPRALPCPWWQELPIQPPPGMERLCIGEVDWALGSRHQVGAPSPQMDRVGNYWLFDNFSNGMETNSYLEVGNLQHETITANFVRGGQVTFLTVPSGLKLDINGRNNWPSYNFVSRPGDVYQVSAPDEQTGSDGRVYVFVGWSNEGAAAQEIRVPDDVIDNGYRLTAQYQLLSQVLITSDPPGTPVEVDGETCQTPCALNQPDGTQVQVVAPLQRTLSPVHRLEFANWSDGAERQRTVTIHGNESIHLTANYTNLYHFETGSSPAGGADFTMAPPSEDGFYAEGTQVTVTAEALEGYRFRRWEGDLSGTFNMGSLKLTAPKSVVAMLDEVPVVGEAIVLNAVGETPVRAVAAGSIISIYGSDLAPYLQIAGGNPLPQTLAGVTVWVHDRVLALLFVAPGQINAILPYDLPPGEYTVVVQHAGKEDVTGTFTMAESAPGLFGRVFTGEVFVMAAHEDGTAVTPDSPARSDEVISIYGTGFGRYDRVVPYGFQLPSSPEYKLVNPVEVFAGEIPLEAEFVGGAAGYSGADILKIRITDAIPVGSTLLFRIRIDGNESNTVLLPVQ